MKVLVVSDTHLRRPTLPKADVLIHAGDATFRGDIREVSLFAEWWNALEIEQKIFIPGNHDRLFEFNPTLASSMLPGTHVLIDQALEIEGKRFYGSPWQPWFNDWAFNLSRGPEIAKKWERIPVGLDVLITHGPPHKIRDYTPGGESVGCKDLFAHVMRAKPRYHIFGHVHYSYGMTSFHDVTFINASICDERYQPTNHAMAFHL